MARIGIFGGSFNPPHLGHRLAVAEFQKKLNLDTVLVVPSAVPPHKQLSSNSPDAASRLEMTRLLFKDMESVRVLDLEFKRNGPSYTADTLAALKNSYPEDRLFLLMGTDMFLSFSRWYRPESISALATLVVAHRSEDDILSLQGNAQKLSERFGTETLFLENSFLPYSSTSVRAMLAFHCGEKYLSEDVYHFICKNKLYYTAENFKNLPFERLSEVSLSLHKPNRVQHVIGCSETAAKLAELYGENAVEARRAGILHDITKALNGSEQLHLCEKYDIILNQFERNYPKLLHAKTGAAIARCVFGESEVIADAINWHTTGKAHMTTMEKIVYLADYMEPNRNFEGVDELRRLTYKDLDAALHLGLQMSVEQLNRRGLEVDPNSLAALHSLEDKE